MKQDWKNFRSNACCIVKHKIYAGFDKFIPIQFARYILHIRFLLVVKNKILQYCILFMTSNHKTTNFVSPIFSMNFSQFELLKNITHFFLIQNRFFSQFWTNEKLFFSCNCSTEKILLKKLVKTRFVVWWFNVTNWLFTIFCSVLFQIKYINCFFRLILVWNTQANGWLTIGERRKIVFFYRGS